MAFDDIPIEPPVIHPQPPQPPQPPATETRNVLDIGGNIIGTLTLLQGTPEQIWASTLGLYSSIYIPPTFEILKTYNVNSVSPVTTSSATPATVVGMTFQPSIGTYLAFFSGSINTGGASAQGEFGIYVDGVLIPETRRDISCNLQLLGGLVTISLNTISVGTYTSTQLDLGGVNVVDVRFRSTNGGTIGFSTRNFMLIKVK